MQVLIGIAIGIAIPLGTIIALRLICQIKLRKLEKELERLTEQTQPIYGYPGRRYKEDGSYTGGKTLLETNYAIQLACELSERPEKETDSGENQN